MEKRRERRAGCTDKSRELCIYHRPGLCFFRIGFFKEEDFTVLSRITIRITLTAAIITSFSGKTIDLSLLSLVALGIGCGLVYIAIGFFGRPKAEKEQLAFDMLNLSGYNIGAFVIPFAQSFLGPMGVIATSLFDTGNAVICLGGSLAFLHPAYPPILASVGALCVLCDHAGAESAEPPAPPRRSDLCGNHRQCQRVYGDADDRGRSEA